MRPTIPALELQRIINTLATQLHRNPVDQEYSRGYRDALAGVAMLTGVHPATVAARAELCTLQPAGCEIEVRP